MKNIFVISILLMTAGIVSAADVANTRLSHRPRLLTMGDSITVKSETKAEIDRIFSELNNSCEVKILSMSEDDLINEFNNILTAMYQKKEVVINSDEDDREFFSQLATLQLISFKLKQEELADYYSLKIVSEVIRIYHFKGLESLVNGHNFLVNGDKPQKINSAILDNAFASISKILYKLSTGNERAALMRTFDLAVDATILNAKGEARINSVAYWVFNDILHIKSIDSLREYLAMKSQNIKEKIPQDSYEKMKITSLSI